MTIINVSNQSDLWKKWSQKANTALTGKKITGARYLTPPETEAFGWYKPSLVIDLDDGSCLIAQMDDEGDDGGVIVHLDKDGNEEIFPTL